MSIRRYSAIKDSTITNAFKNNLETRAVKANMGESDVLEIFSIYGQASTSSVELSRVLIQFPIDKILTDRNAGKIGISGSAKFILKLSNAEHGDSTPKKFNIVANPLSSSWLEGAGLDMENYSDIGPVNWLSSSNTSSWATPGGDYLYQEYSQYLESGVEDLELDITPLVEAWISAAIPNNGLLIKLSDSAESATESFYTKKFFARGSEYFYKRPWIECRTNDAFTDDRNNFILSSSLLDSEDNLNTLVLYNKVNGVLKDIPIGTGSIYVSLYSGSNIPLGPPLVLHNGLNKIEGGKYSTGVYTASLAVNTDISYLYDVWHNGSGTIYATGSMICTKKYNPDFSSDTPQYIVNIANLKSIFKNNEVYKFKTIIRDKYIDLNSYNVVTGKSQNRIIENLFYKISRISDKLEIIPYGQHTKLSYDRDGNYFSLDMNLFEPDYAYVINFAYQYGEEFVELVNTFKFRVE